MPGPSCAACGTLLGLAFYTLDRRASPHRAAQPGDGVSVAARGRAARDCARGLRALRPAAVRAAASSARCRRGRCWRASSSTARSASRLAYAQGKGVLFITGHFGFWELQAMVHALRVEPIGVLARALDNPYLNQLLEDIRQRTGNTVIYRQGTIRRVMRDAAGRARRRGADRSAHHEPRRDLRRFLRSAGGDDVGGRGAGAAHRRAGRAGVRAAARPRALPADLRASRSSRRAPTRPTRSASSRSAAPTCSRCTCAAIPSCGCGCTADGATIGRSLRARRGCFRRQSATSTRRGRRRRRVDAAILDPRITQSTRETPEPRVDDRTRVVVAPDVHPPPD